MAGFVGKVLATAAGIAVWEVVVRPMVAPRLTGDQGELDGCDEEELRREIDECERELASRDEDCFDDDLETRTP